MKTTVISSLTLILTGGITVQAKDKEENPVPPALLAKCDKDGDGQLSREEDKAMQDDMKARKSALFDEYDANEDGNISKEEHKTMTKAIKAERQELLAKYDADKDGMLGPEECKAAIIGGADPYRLMGHGGHAQHRPRGKK